MLKRMAKWQLSGLHLLMTSRDESVIRSSFENYMGEEEMLCLDNSVDVQQDAELFRKHLMESHTRT